MQIFKIYIFSDRVEITNPGGLVNGITIKELGKRSLSRNNLLFGLMQRMDLVEKIGSGILRMKKAMKEYGLPNPKIETNENWFSIIFKRRALESIQERDSKESAGVVGKATQKTVEKTVEKILILIGENKNITQDEISKKLV
ncbi:MAG: ATP-binding protein [Candidatus Moraniibacteriota bacterium]